MQDQLAFPRAAMVLLLSCVPLLSGDPKLNGRWNIEVLNQPVPAAWWLEIVGAEGTAPRGRFTGAPGGQTDDIGSVAIREGEVRFSVEKKPRVGKPFRCDYVARLRNETLEGVFTSQGRAEVKWIGRRAPAIDERDDGTWREVAPVALFNGKDISGWRTVDPRKTIGWTVKDGIFTNQGGGANIVSEKRFWNFVLHAVFRVQKGSNSGIGLRGRYEAQIWDDYGRPLDGHSTGTIYGRILPSVNATKPPGEWQTYDIRLVGRQATVVLNGVKVIDRKEIDGFTAIAMDPNEAAPGPIFLQGDHGMAEFREIVVTPLEKRR